MSTVVGALQDRDAMAHNEAAGSDLGARTVSCRHGAVEDMDDHDGG